MRERGFLRGKPPLNSVETQYHHTETREEGVALGRAAENGENGGTIQCSIGRG